MRVSVLGLGYVGCVSAACLAHAGHHVIGVDTNPQKVQSLASGKSPVVEPGLEKLVEEAVGSGNLQSICDCPSAVSATEVTLICVGTPSNGNGSLNLKFMENVCREIGTALARKRSYHVVVVRSTVLPGTVEGWVLPLLEKYSGYRAGLDFGVSMNPEFLREGSAINDHLHPSLVVIGELDQRSGDVVRGLYESIDAPIIRTPIRTAEMVKYTSNAFHALKVVFANEIGSLCKAQGIDGQEVMEIFCRDRQLNISASYLKPGFAFGGSCLPKDIRALLYRAKQLDVECSMLSAVLASNKRQMELAIRLIENTGLKKIGILGLSFKAGTDDVRESPTIELAETLLGRGHQIRIFDETVQVHRLIGSNKHFLERELPHIASLMCSSMDQLVFESEVVVVANGSKGFHKISELMNSHQVLIDLVGVARGNGNMQSVYDGICW